MNIEQQCRLLYKQAFSDPDTSFENILFDTCFCHCRYLTVGDTVASMLFALPCQIQFKDQRKSAVYIFAAATEEAMRQKGYMSELIRGVQKSNDGLIFLRPANDRLIGYYKNLNFKAFEARDSKENLPLVIPCDGFKELASRISTDTCNSTFTCMHYGGESIELNGLNFAYSMN